MVCTVFRANNGTTSEWGQEAGTHVDNRDTSTFLGNIRKNGEDITATTPNEYNVVPEIWS